MNHILKCQKHPHTFLPTFNPNGSSKGTNVIFSSPRHLHATPSSLFADSSLSQVWHASEKPKGWKRNTENFQANKFSEGNKIGEEI